MGWYTHGLRIGDKIKLKNIFKSGSHEPSRQECDQMKREKRREHEAKNRVKG